MDLISQNEYSLSQLFSSEKRKIIIPDFQRDYCWGDKTHGEKKDSDIVSGFLETLLGEFKNNRDSDVLLGKIDVYNHPKNHIYLTDGQQRLTSLYLLIGMLYKRIKVEKLKNCLISDFEEQQDDKEPYLQYAVRESTVFFLRDLVNAFFIKDIKENTLKVSEIKNQPWYFSEYDLDPSIISMLSALSIIEEKLKDIETIDFAEFIINKIKIQYYDVQDKKHGEERFVIINTTGKSLTVSENIKPILLGNLDNPNDYAKQWEERETWFWKNRNIEKEKIADAGVNDFLTWCFQIKNNTENIDIIKKSKELLKRKENKPFLDSIQRHFDSVKLLIEYLKDDNFQKQFKFINNGKSVLTLMDLRRLPKEEKENNVTTNLLIPLLSFMSKFGDDYEGAYQFLRRLRKNFFDIKWNDRRHNYIEWRYILQIIDKSSSPIDCLHNNHEFEKNGNDMSKSKWFNDEERIKEKLKEHYRSEIEDWEDHPDFMGDLSFLFQSTILKASDCDIPVINTQTLIEFNKILKIYKNYQSTIDLIRTEENASINLKLANVFRLFRLFIGCNKVGHIYKCSWDFEGVLFSKLNRNHLHKIEFMKLLNSDDLFFYCEQFIKQKIHDESIFDLNDFTVSKFLKAWLSLKVFNANEKQVLLSFYDGNDTGVAAYVDKNKNRLIDTQEFSIYNSICGFGVKSGFGYGNQVDTTDKVLWLNSNVIDTPFDGVEYDYNYRTLIQIESNKKAIEKVIDIINPY